MSRVVDDCFSVFQSSKHLFHLILKSAFLHQICHNKYILPFTKHILRDWEQALDAMH
jgi:hypothetical protein